MTSAEFMKVILEKIHAALKPAGFKKSGTAFLTERNDVVWVVQVQKSQKTTRELLVTTVNLGVFSHLLAARLGQDSSKPTVWDCHWQERIGFLVPERYDKWWEVASNEKAHDVGDEIVGILTKHGIPTLEHLSSTSSLRSLWTTGKSPGLTEVQRRRYLSLI